MRPRTSITALLVWALCGLSSCGDTDETPTDGGTVGDTEHDQPDSADADSADSPDTVNEPAAAPLLAVRVEGSVGYFVDPDGREVLLRGINVNSLGEYWQFDPDIPAVLDFTEDDMDVIASMGFNLVRLVLTWSRVEPAPGEYDAAYLEEVSAVVDGLWERGIYTLVDMHQDAWGPTLAARPDEGCAETEFPAGGWDGAPGWATLVDDETKRCIPLLGDTALREMSPAVQEAWAALLEDAEGPGGVGLHARFAAMWREVAETLGPRPGVMGYDLINEPNAMFGGRQLLQLADLYVVTLAAVREGEDEAGVAPRVVVFEPTALWPNLPSGSVTAPFSDDAQLAYGPHIYQGSISPVPLNDTQIRRMTDEAAAYGGVPLLSGEWGTTPSTAADPNGYLARMIGLQDEHKWGVVFWLYQSACGDPHGYKGWTEGDTQHSGSWGLREMDCDSESGVGPIRQAQYDRLARPALHYAPGVIDVISWAPETSELAVSGSDAPAGNELVLFLPQAHADLHVVPAGIDGLDSSPWHGGLLWVGQATGGDWSLEAAPAGL